MFRVTLQQLSSSMADTLTRLYVDEKKTVRKTLAALELLGYDCKRGTLQKALKQLGILRTPSEAGKLRPRGKRNKKPIYGARTCRACARLFTPSSSKELFCDVCAPNDTAWRYLYTYGITAEQAGELLEKQENKCAICDTSFVGMPVHRRHLDHDHKTGKIRGWLCCTCNSKLVGVENTVWLQRAIRYLQQDGVTPAHKGYLSSKIS